MQPELDHFLQRYNQHQQELANQPSPEQVFMEGQFKDVVSALQTASTAMINFLKGYHATTTVDNFPKTVGTPDVKQVVSAVKNLEKSLKPDNSEVVKTLKSLQDDIKNLPSAMPDSDTAVVASLSELTSRFSSELGHVIAAIKAQDLKPQINLPAPKVTVTPAPVTVQPTDVGGVIKALNDVKKEVRNKPVPGTPNVPTDPLIYYLPADIDDAGTVQYYGYTDNKGAWYIRKYDSSASPKTIRFAFGQSSYATNFTNRASLSYSLWGS